jgi:hypothetical protein
MHADEAHLEQAAAGAGWCHWEPFAVVECVRERINGTRESGVAPGSSAGELGGTVHGSPARHGARGPGNRGRKCQRREDGGSKQSARGEHCTYVR